MKINNTSKKIIATLRVCTGWLLFYGGITKVLDPNWTSANYLTNAQTFQEFYTFLARPEILPFVDLLNQWGLTILGAMLILGILVKPAGKLGALIMILYYFPALTFPTIGHGYIVDEHIIYALVLLLLAEISAGSYFGFDALRKKIS